MRVIKVLLLCVSAGWLYSCEDQVELEPVPEQYPGVDSELKAYFQRFEEEAAARGLSIDLTATGITGVIQEIEENHVLGTCSYPRAQPNRVTIDQSFWNRGSDLFREFVVFHELGHCFLFRPHKETLLSNGACASIMRSGNGTCIDNYNGRTRMFYVNELFDYQPQALVSR